MISARSKIIEFIEQGTIPLDKIDDALVATKVVPDGKSWRSFIDFTLLCLGALALAFSVMFFIAFNWNNIGYFAKFGLVEGLITLAIIIYCKCDEHATAGKVSLLVATILLGVLLALYGQVYQTGADPWQLFFNWALLMLPWAFIGRFPAIWVVWVVLINTSIFLYFRTFRGILWVMSDYVSGILWLTFLFNTFVLVVWEFLAINWRWLAERWAIRLVAAGSGVPMTLLVLFTILENRIFDDISGLVWGLWLVIMYFIYRKISPDLFMLAGICLSGIIVTVTFLGNYLVEIEHAGVLLFLSLLVSVMGAKAAYWLKTVHKELYS